MATLPRIVNAQLPNKPLKSWTPHDIARCIESVPSLANSVDTAKSALLRHRINGRTLEKEAISPMILEDMFPGRLQRRKFLAEVQKWKMMRSKIIHVRASTGEQFNLTNDVPPKVTLNMPMTRVRLIIEDFLNLPRDVCALMDTRGRHLADAKESTLTLNNITWGSELFVDVAPAQVPDDEKDGPIRRTDAADLISKEDDPRYPRARMPCSDLNAFERFLLLAPGQRRRFILGGNTDDHGMTAMSMKLHVEDSLRRFQFEVFCPDPDCKMLWDWNLCLEIAQFDTLEINRLNKIRDTNRSTAVDTVKICPNPSCGTPISKGELRSNRVRCPGCSQEDICWRCLKPWVPRSLLSGRTCGNKGCDTELLQTCEVQELSEVEKARHPDFPEFPIARSCPRCETIVIHREQCKHVHCSRCSLQFCMSCLKPRGEASWTCGSPFGPCPTGIAPR